ncbi:MAG: UDP-N-acetylmuramate--L-alanine ligase [Patescibacteria group bacterium]
MNLKDIKSAHLIGIGGINMSAVAKLLLSQGIKVTGSDLVESEETRVLAERVAKISIGHSESGVPADADIVIYTSAVPESNPEREEARRRDLLELTNFQFLGEWFKDAKTILVTGTHGKSTTTSMLGLVLERAGLDPTVIVGSKVPSFPEGNLRIGQSEYFVIEGDEYAKHFLEFHPYAVLINNIELDHTDIFPTLQDVIAAFRELISKIKNSGIIVANVGDERVASLIEIERVNLESRSIRIIRFNGQSEADWKISSRQDQESSHLSMERMGVTYRFELSVPGFMNALNAAGAALMARELGTEYQDIAVALQGFKGIWRRFELLKDTDGIKIYSDYGHHPTAVVATLKMVKEAFPDSRIVLCFQPHHRNRTRNLFDYFVSSFDLADVLVLCEVYDVAGRDEVADADVSSKNLVEAVVKWDTDSGIKRLVEYAPNPAEAVEKVQSLMKPGDVVIYMGAGDIDAAIRNKIEF